MSRRRLLLLDVGDQPMGGLAEQLRQIGVRVLHAKGAEPARAALAETASRPDAVVIPPDLPSPELERIIHALRCGEDSRHLPLLVTGARPDAGLRARLRRGGAEYALWRPLDEHTLRFQLNRVLAKGGPEPSARGATRVPVHWPVRVTCGLREKQAAVYSLSSRGAYLATPRPSPPHALVHLTLPLPGGDLRLAGEVMMSNVPGNLSRDNLPLGMGVRFTGHSAEAEQSLLDYTRARGERLLV